MLLIAFVVTEHVNAIEVRLVNSLLPVRTAFFEYQPASRLSFTRTVLVGIGVLVAVETLPRNKLASGAIEDDIARHRELNLFAVDPA